MGASSPRRHACRCWGWGWSRHTRHIYQAAVSSRSGVPSKALGRGAARCSCGLLLCTTDKSKTKTLPPPHRPLHSLPGRGAGAGSRAATAGLGVQLRGCHSVQRLLWFLTPSLCDRGMLAMPAQEWLGGAFLPPPGPLLEHGDMKVRDGGHLAV